MDVFSANAYNWLSILWVPKQYWLAFLCGVLVALSLGFFYTSTVWAAIGDFAIYRESTGTETITSSTSTVTFDTTVSSNVNLPLESDQATIDLAEGGKYLLLYNVLLEQGTSTLGSDRRSAETWAALNGTPIPYGWSGGYIRDTENDLQMFPAGAAILDAAAGDDLTVAVRRNDTNGGAGTNVAPDSNGISVLKFKDDIAFTRLHQSSPLSNIDTYSTFTPVTWDTVDELDTGTFGFSAGTSDITLRGAADDHFLVTVNLALEQTAGVNTRQHFEMRLLRDGVEIPGTRTGAYVRGNDGVFRNTLNYSGIITKQVTADESLAIEVRRSDSGTGATTDIMADRAAIAIAALPDSGQYVSLNRTSDLPLTTSYQAVGFDDQQELDDSFFTHSTSTNTSRITVAEPGDYLFFSTVYTDRDVSNTNRDVPRFDWRRNGSTLVPYGAHGSFNRGLQGAQTTNTSGSSGGTLISGLGAGEYVELVGKDITSGVTDSIIQANRVAVQGVERSLLFNTTVDVSATGTQRATTSIPATDIYLGGTFVITETTATRTVNGVTLTETGSIDAAGDVANVELYYEFDNTAPYDCSSESYSGTEAQFGGTDSNGFSGPNGTVSFTDTVDIATTSTWCGYVVLDTLAGTNDGDTISVVIERPSTDVSINAGTIGPNTAVSPQGDTTALNDDLTQIHYHWRNDDGSESGATSATGGSEDTPLTDLTIGDPRRLRLQVSNEGAAASDPVRYRLEYAEKTSTCSAATTWNDVGASGGAWDMATSGNLTEGADTTDIAVGLGGTSNENTTFLTSNEAVRDETSETGTLTLTSNQFLETEFSIVATMLANENARYCFRVSDQGTALSSYARYPEAEIVSNLTVDAIGTQIGTVTSESTDTHLGGAFTLQSAGGARSISSITLTSTGTIDAQTGLANVRLAYEFDTSTPYDCTSESYGGGEATTTGSAFTSSTGSSTFSGPFAVDDTTSLCGYVVFDTTASSSNGETINLVVADPPQDVSVSAGSVGPDGVIDISGETIVESPVLNQAHYHWRNDDGSETGASSATGGSEDTPVGDARLGTTKRLRLAVANDGLISANNNAFRLEYGEKVSTCAAVSNWSVVGSGPAFTMHDSSFLTDDDDTTNISLGTGGVSDPDTTFLTPNGGVKDTSAITNTLALATDEFVELEYSLKVTESAQFDTEYCFRVTNSGVTFNTYAAYPELRTLPEQDFFVQRGTETITGTSTTLVAGADYVAPGSSSSAFIRITNTSYTGAGSVNTGTQNADDVTAYIEDPGNIQSSVTIARPAAAINDTRVSWEIVEYVGLSGADNEMVVRDHGTVAYSNTGLSVTGPSVSGVDDDSDVVVFITGQRNRDAGVNNYNDGLSTSEWDATNDQPVFTRADADSVISSISYAVVEFTGLNWSIQRVSHTYTATGGTETEPITPVNDLTRTFLHTQKRVGNQLNGLDEYGHQVWLSSVGAVSFQLESGADDPGLHTSVAWIIENTQTGIGEMEVYRSSGVDSGGAEPTAKFYPIGTTLANISNASIYANNDSSGGGTAFPRPIIGVTIASTTDYEFWQSDNGQGQAYRTEVVEYPVAQLSLRQNYYRWYVDNDALDPVDPWPNGPSDLGENGAITVNDTPLGTGDVIRLRTTIAVNNATLPADSTAVKLQFAERSSTCSAVTTWTDVGTAASSTIWRGHAGTPIDGTSLSTDPPGVGDLNISVSDRAGTYEEDAVTATNPYAAAPGEDVEYDWVLEQNGAPQKTDYCFRMIQADGSVLDGYSYYPVLRTSAFEPVVANWRWYTDETNETPTTDLANETVTPSDVPNTEVVKLRVRLDETQGADGENVRFGLQFSESSSFADGGQFVVASTSCTANSLWCYENAAGVDGAVIDQSVLSGVDTCSAGTGVGCGTYNESTSTPVSFTQSARAKTEYEFTLAHAGARANAVYYFRPYDLTNNVPVAASTSYPSVQTEGAALTFTIAGLTSGTSTEGVVTGATTTATGVDFGSLPIGSSVTAAQRVTVDTNATDGYQIYAFYRQPLISAGGETIADVAASNTAPSSWSVACQSGAAGCFGYHTGDDALSNGSTRFAADDTYAAFSSTPEEFMYSTFPTVDTHDVVYQIQVDALQPAGIYETEIVYIAVPRF